MESKLKINTAGEPLLHNLKRKKNHCYKIVRYFLNNIVYVTESKTSTSGRHNPNIEHKNILASINLTMHLGFRLIFISIKKAPLNSFEVFVLNPMLCKLLEFLSMLRYFLMFKPFWRWLVPARKLSMMLLKFRTSKNNSHWWTASNS